MILKTIEKLHVTLFYLVLVFIPINLGKHFIYKWTYVNGILVDYLIPTVYITDILMLLVLVLWGLALYKGAKVKTDLINITFIQLLVLFLFSAFLSALTAERLYPAFFAVIRLVLTFGFFIYVYEHFDFNRDFKKILYVISAIVVFEAVLSLVQWFNQASVFNNYLFFGEQPYTTSTPYIVKENFFGTAKIPPYGTFKHPNILGAFLSIFLIWLIKLKTRLPIKLFIYVIGLTVLFLTYSRFSWLAFILGLVFYIATKKHKKVLPLCAIVTVLIIGVSVALPLVPNHSYYTDNPSFYIRSDLLTASYKQLAQTPLFGCGLNNSPVCLTPYLTSSIYLHFIQPVHNMYILVLVELGFVSFLLFVAFLIVVLKSVLTAKTTDNIFAISLLQILILGSFDHYFFTSHSAQIIFWLTISFLLKYNLTNEEN